MAKSGNITVEPEQFAETMQSILYELPAKTDNAITRAAKTVSKKAVKELKATSPASKYTKHRGRYRKGWTTKTSGNKVIIHNRTDYQLTHLLEYGHDIVVNGKKVSEAKAKPHIKAVEKMVQEEMVDEVEKELDKL